MPSLADKKVYISPPWSLGRFAVCLVILVVACISGTSNSALLTAQTFDATSRVDATSKKVADSAETLAVKPAGSLTNAPRRRKYRFEKLGAIVFRRLPGCEVKCDVYQPESDVALPSVIMIHGGAWRQGSKLSMIRHARRLARVGYVVVSINYRLAPEHPWPAQIDDCRYAVRWLKKNAQTYNVDAERIGVFGYSAGGHLAALLGTMGEEGETLFEESLADADEELKKFSTSVDAVAVGGAPCEFSWLDEESVVLKYWMGGSRKSHPEKYRRASPVEHVTADDTPFFIFHGTTDMLVPVQSSIDFHQSLKAVGVPATLVQVDGAGHLATFSRADLLNQIIPFFDKHLQHGPLHQKASINQ